MSRLPVALCPPRSVEQHAKELEAQDFANTAWAFATVVHLDEKVCQLGARVPFKRRLNKPKTGVKTKKN